jgi:hypothetical protein
MNSKRRVVVCAPDLIAETLVLAWKVMACRGGGHAKGVCGGTGQGGHDSSQGVRQACLFHFYEGFLAGCFPGALVFIL